MRRVDGSHPPCPGTRRHTYEMETSHRSSSTISERSRPCHIAPVPDILSIRDTSVLWTTNNTTIMAYLARELNRTNSITGRRRDSSTQNASRPRPRLLRSSATEPSVSAPNAIKGSLVSPNCQRRATDILSKVAIYSPATTGMGNPILAANHEAAHTEPITIVQDGHNQSSDVNLDSVLSDTPSSGSSVQPRSQSVCTL